MAYMDKRFLKQAFVALIICAVAEVIAGAMLSRFEDILLILPGLLIMIPPTIGMRGNVYGAFGAKLTTALHIGSIDLDEDGRGGLFRYSVMTFGEAVLLAYIIPVLAALFMAPGPDFWHYSLGLFFVMAFSSLLSGLIMTASTVYVVLTSYRRGVDPDNVAAPLITTIGDVITIPIMFLSVVLYLYTPTTLAIAFVLVFIAVVPWTYHKGEGTGRKRYLKERLPVMIVCMVLSAFAGVALEHNLNTILLGTIYLSLVPLFNALGGSVGSINVSRLSTAYYLGLVDINSYSLSDLRRSFIELDLLATLVFFASSTILLSAGELWGLATPPIHEFYLFVLIAGQLVVFFATVLGIGVARLSVRMNMNMDNISIPIITSIMDLMGSVVLVSLLYVL